MRIIAGDKRGLRLKSPAGNDVRPTADKVRGAIFSAIQNDIHDKTVFVDLFAGSGAMGIEALSRGAERAYFFDVAGKSLGIIRENLKRAAYTDRAIVMKRPAFEALRYLAKEKICCDVIFMDPPYAMGKDTISLIQKIADEKILNNDGIIMIEHEKSVIMPISVKNMIRTKEKKYGITIITTYKQGEILHENSGLSGEL